MTKHGVYTGNANFLSGFKTVAGKAHERVRRVRNRLLSMSGASVGTDGSDDGHGGAGGLAGAGADGTEKEVELGATSVDPARPRVVDPFAAGAGAMAGALALAAARSLAASRKDGLEVHESLAGSRKPSLIVPVSMPARAVQHSSNVSLRSLVNDDDDSVQQHGAAGGGAGSAAGTAAGTRRGSLVLEELEGRDGDGDGDGDSQRQEQIVHK